jgi:cell division protein FtsQ
MASNSSRKSGSSGRSSSRKRVVIGAEETVRVKYRKKGPEVEAERKRGRASGRAGEKVVPASGRPTTAAGRVAAVKRDEREGRRRAVSRRRLLVGAAGLAVAAFVVWGLWAVWNSPIFSATDVRVIGAKRLSSAQVLKLAAISPSDTLPNLPKRDIQMRVATSPWVDTVRVTRRLPHTVEIAIAEREPAAVVDVGGGVMWLVSGDGHWIAPRTAEVTATLTPVRDLPAQTPVAGQKAGSREIENALAVLSGLSPQMRSRLKAISAPTLDRTALLLKGDVQVFVGPSTDIAKKDTIARAVLAREKNVVYINVRTVDRPVWRGLTPTP